MNYEGKQEKGDVTDQIPTGWFISRFGKELHYI